jgi:hypothetical protein
MTMRQVKRPLGFVIYVGNTAVFPPKHGRFLFPLVSMGGKGRDAAVLPTTPDLLHFAHLICNHPNNSPSGIGCLPPWNIIRHLAV